MKNNNTSTIADLKKFGYPCPQCKHFNPDYEIRETDLVTFHESGECLATDFSYMCPYSRCYLQLDGEYLYWLPPLSDIDFSETELDKKL